MPKTTTHGRAELGDVDDHVSETTYQEIECNACGEVTQEDANHDHFVRCLKNVGWAVLYDPKINDGFTAYCPECLEDRPEIARVIQKLRTKYRRLNEGTTKRKERR